MITRFNRDKLAKNLPDAYRKDDDSNNAKILAAEHAASCAVREAVKEIEDSLDINLAYGKTLDLYGEIVGQLRGSTTDEQYRVLIKNKLARNFANADYNSVVLAICMTFDCEPTEIKLTEQDEPCKVKLEGLPISQLVACNIDIDTALQIVTGLLPAGVQLESLDFSGSFEFSGGTELVFDEGAGFADEAQTIGGYLGLVAGGSNSGESGTQTTPHGAVLGEGILGLMILGQS